MTETWRLTNEVVEQHTFAPGTHAEEELTRYRAKLMAGERLVMILLRGNVTDGNRIQRDAALIASAPALAAEAKRLREALERIVALDAARVSGYEQGDYGIGLDDGFERAQKMIREILKESADA